MRQQSKPPRTVEQTVREIRQATRKQYLVKEKFVSCWLA